MEHKDYRLAAVMFTDIVGFSRMMEEDEKGTLKTLDFHDKLVREQVDRFRGSVIKTIGDAFLAQFSTTLDAVECSLAVQDGIREYNDAKIGKPLTLRIGVHLGDIYFYENDALGEGINIASRLQSATKPGHITISREVYSQVSGKIPMRVESMGQVHLKNITREVHAYEIIPGGEDNNSNAYRQARRAEEVPAVQTDPEPTQAPPPAQAHEVPRSRPNPGYGPPQGPPPAFRDLRDEWRTLKDQVKDQVKDQIRESGVGSWRDVRHELRSEFRRARHQGMAHEMNIDPASVVSQIFRDPLDDLKAEDGTPATAFQIYKQKKLRDVKRAKGGFRGHLVPFLAVNGFLTFLYFTVSAGQHPWFLYPLFGWGIGLVSHWTAVKAAKKSAGELEQLDDASDEDLRAIRKFQDSRGAMFGHLGSNLAVSALLLMIWAVNGGGFPWPLIPIGAMAIGVFSHLAGFSTRRSEFKDTWKSLTSGGRKPSKKVKNAQAPEPEVDPIVRKARALRDSIVSQAQGMKGGNPFGDDMTVTLENYVLQIGELSAIERELGQVVTSFNHADLQAEATSLRGKIASTGSSVLKQEYEKSLGEVEKQKKSFDDLAEQQEILNLRMKSAMGNLQQMQVDLARIKGLSDGQKEGSFLSIKERSEELSRYIEDYREGLKEIPD
jgi:class 3 adenylate cyclase